MGEQVYDSRMWTGEIPDYRAMIYRALGLYCAWHRFHIVLHFHSHVDAETQAEIVRFCAALTNTDKGEER